MDFFYKKVQLTKLRKWRLSEAKEERRPISGWNFRGPWGAPYERGWMYWSGSCLGSWGFPFCTWFTATRMIFKDDCRFRLELHSHRTSILILSYFNIRGIFFGGSKRFVHPKRVVEDLLRLWPNVRQLCLLWISGGASICYNSHIHMWLCIVFK